MPAISNARHELFCQLIVQGKKQDDAYAEAGFTKNKGNASSLKNKPHIQNRIQELLEAKSQLTLQQTAKEVEFTRDKLLSMLQEAYDVAIESDRGQGAAVSAVVAMARITGQIIDRREVGEVGAFDAMTDAELVEQAAKKAKELGLAKPRLVYDGEEPETVGPIEDDEDKSGVG